MLNRYLLRPLTGEQRAQWDAFVENHTGGHLLQSWGWGELKAGAGWQPLRLALWDTAEQRITAAAQVLRRTAPHIPPRLGHLAYVPRGPVTSWQPEPGMHTSPGELLLELLRDYIRKQGAIALQIEPAQEDTPAQQIIHESLKRLDFAPAQAIQPLRSIILNLEPGEDALLAGMKEKWRYNVRLAGRKGVQVRTGTTVEDVHQWYRLLQTTGERDRFGIHTFDYYLRAWQIFAPRQQLRLLLAYAGEQLLAGIFVGLMAKQAIYLYGASSNEQRQLMPNYLLQWEAIRWAKSMGVTSYDFWGIPESDDAAEAMAGVYRFKSGWGGRVVRFMGNYEHVYHPLAMGLVRRFMR